MILSFTLYSHTVVVCILEMMKKRFPPVATAVATAVAAAACDWSVFMRLISI
jgi:hypothetical protein